MQTTFDKKFTNTHKYTYNCIIQFITFGTNNQT